jgi:hypothetical protein
MTSCRSHQTSTDEAVEAVCFSFLLRLDDTVAPLFLEQTSRFMCAVLASRFIILVPPFISSHSFLLTFVVPVRIDRVLYRSVWSILVAYEIGAEERTRPGMQQYVVPHLAPNSLDSEPGH